MMRGCDHQIDRRCARAKEGRFAAPRSEPHHQRRSHTAQSGALPRRPTIGHLVHRGDDLQLRMRVSCLAAIRGWATPAFRGRSDVGALIRLVQRLGLVPSSCFPRLPGVAPRIDPAKVGHDFVSVLREKSSRAGAERGSLLSPSTRGASLVQRGAARSVVRKQAGPGLIRIRKMNAGRCRLERWRGGHCPALGAVRVACGGESALATGFAQKAASLPKFRRVHSPHAKSTGVVWVYSTRPRMCARTAAARVCVG